MNKLLIIDDEKSLLNALKFTFEDKYEVLLANNMYEVNEQLLNNKPNAALVDLRFGKLSGLEVLKKIKYMYPDTIIIVMTAYGTIDTSIKAIKLGAYDYVQKPIDMDSLHDILDNALNYAEHKKKILIKENSKENLYKVSDVHSMAVNSRKMRDVLSIVDKVSKLNVNVLIQGESGTGKELIARAIHEQSDRRDSVMEVINCGAIPDNLIESELFGHVKGAFTGAIENKKGVFERAHKSTLFLDEIGEMSLSSQVKLLRVLQEKMFTPVGGQGNNKIDVRVIAATNRNLEEEVEKGNFRRDLFYRLNVMMIQIPPLRERKEDIPFLISHFIKKANDTYNTSITGVNKNALDVLLNYEYKGNIRELENIIYRSVIMSTNAIDESSLPVLSSGKEQFYGEDFIQIKIGAKLADVELAAIEHTLEYVNGNKSKAAKILGISERSIYYKTKKT